MEHRGILKHIRLIFDFCKPSSGHLGAILGPSSGLLGPSCCVLGPSCGHLEPSWGILQASRSNLVHPALVLASLKPILALLVHASSH